MAQEEIVDFVDEEEGELYVDFTDVPDLGPVPAGAYTASITKAVGGRSKSKNLPKIDLHWKIEGDEEFDGHMVFQTLSFAPNAMAFTKRYMKGMGFPEDLKGSLRPDEFVGITATIVVTIEQSDGINQSTGERYDPRNVVKRIYQGEGDLDDLLDD